MNLKIGNIKQKASPILSTFVISCAIVIVGMLYVMQKVEDTAVNWYNGSYWEYM